MNPITRTHSKSCVLDSIAYITQLPAQALINMVGTDGVENGHNMQQFTEVLLRHGWTMTPIERHPKAVIDGVVMDVDIEPSGANERFQASLRAYDGILMGHWKHLEDRPHCVAWKDGRIINPSATLHELEFIGTIFWVFKQRKIWI